MIDHAQSGDSRVASLVSTGTSYAQRMAALPPKGTCWYCDQRVDNVRRFCSVACRNDYFEEEGELPFLPGG
jgi:hypothetical protein